MYASQKVEKDLCGQRKVVEEFLLFYYYLTKAIIKFLTKPFSGQSHLQTQTGWKLGKTGSGCVCYWELLSGL